MEAANILRTDRAMVREIKETLKHLPPMQIGKYGQLQEWMHDWDSPDDHHRHVSHLYGVYPGNQISPYRTPELYEAAMTSLTQRGDPSTGWSMNWKINLWARLLDGNHAHRLIAAQLSLVPGLDFAHMDFAGKGGTYPNLFDAHPPFQIDGNFGFTAGVTEMLVQSHDGFIFILPALPDVWANGSICGIRARGGFVIDSLTWENGEIKRLVLTSLMGGNCRIRSYSKLQPEGTTRLHEAVGENTNPLYRTPTIQSPIISSAVPPGTPSLKKTFLYDVRTRAGAHYVFTR